MDGEPMTMTEASVLRSIRREYEKAYKVMIGKLLDAERFLREDERF